MFCVAMVTGDGASQHLSYSSLHIFGCHECKYHMYACLIFNMSEGMIKTKRMKNANLIHCRIRQLQAVHPGSYAVVISSLVVEIPTEMWTCSSSGMINLCAIRWHNIS